MPLSPEWQSFVGKKRADVYSRIPQAWVLPKAITDKAYSESSSSAFELLLQTSLLSKKDVEITENYTAAELVENMVQKKLTSLEVTTAFCKRAAVAQQLTNCCTEIFFEKALERAKKVDAYLSREGKPMGPLHGLPISVKDTFMVEGEFATLGFVSYLKKPVAKQNSFVIDILLNAGAVLYVKTTVPQTLFVCESYSNLFGKTLNPYRSTLTAGGSSSGEGALVGFRGSVLGVGSDIGGSVRAPALCNGTFGFKPTADRLPYGGQQALMRKGWPGVLPAVGPLAHSAEDLSLLVKTVLLAKPWIFDSTALAVPWRDVPKKTKLNIGLFMEDPEFPIYPPVKRSLKVAAQKLENAGHSIISLGSVPSMRAGVAAAARSFCLDTSQSILGYLEEAGEDPIAALAHMSPAAILDNQTEFNLDDMFLFVSEREDYREAWGKIWRENNLDVILCPAYKGTAPRHDNYGPPAYTLIWNLVDFPASVIPFLKADRSVDVESVEGFDIDDAQGTPSHVQVVGWRFQDEEVLMATEIISSILSEKAVENTSLL